jgi:GxxExxY protein
MSDSPFQQEGYDFMTAAFEVHTEKGNGYLEEVYHECLEIELTARGIEWRSKPALLVHYKGQPLRKSYRPDMLVFGEIVVELKAVRALASEHEAQLLTYLRATRKRVGYLVNFGSYPKLEWKRFVLDHLQN